MAMQARLDSEGMAACRSAARRFLRGLRPRAGDVGNHGGMAVDALVEEVAREADQAADAQPSREHRRQFLVELAGEARSELMVQQDADGPRAQFYDALKRRLDEMGRA